MLVKSDAKGRKRWVAPLRSQALKLRAVCRAAVLALTVAAGFAAFSATSAQAETRTLKLYFVHTGERATITYKRNGKFDPDGLAKLNRFLRDWRRNEPTKMDPRLFDLIWNVYQRSGSSDYINVLCGYRSPGTNEMLRTRSRHTGVAKESQHILGKAMDFYIPGVPLEKLREIGLKLQMGGVGYYPTSGSPFVHMDVGGVRAWPRASREVLARLFPDGKTIHLPPDGKPLPGYESAMADYKRRMASENVQIASVGGGGRNLFQMLFGGGGDEDESPDQIASSEAPAKSAPAKAPAKPAEVQVATAAPQPKETYIENLPGVGGAVANAPVPGVRPSLAAAPPADIETALVSPARSAASDAMASVLQPDQADGEQYADLGQYKIPVPELLADRRLPGEAEMDAVPLPGSRPAIEMASVAADSAVAPAELRQPVVAETGGDAPKPVAEDEIAAMIRRMSPAEPAGQAGAAGVTPSQRPQQVALAQPPSANKAQIVHSLKADIRPALSAEGHQPKKGARPSQMDAIAALRGTRGDAPKLTGKLIEQWALAANHAKGLVPDPVDAASRRQEEADLVKVDSRASDAPAAKFNPARF